jgi:hypothetical protein
MLRSFLGTGILLALSSPAIAETVMECNYVGGRRATVAVPLQRPEPITAAIEPAGLDGMLALSVIYPGLVVLMTMTAYYFLRVLEPQTVHDHPRFVRSAVVLSGLWLIGFFPFLSSAYGGFMFCVTAISCTGAWFLMRYFGQHLKFIERVVVFWAFFFFSLFLAILVTGRGAEVALFFNQPVAQIVGLAGEVSRNLGPLLLFLLNIWVALRIFRVMGVKVPRPGSPETIKHLKVVALASGIVILDILMMETRFALVALLPLLLWAAPSVAYYGVYRFVAGMPDKISNRVSPVLFVGLAGFMTVLICIAAGASAKAMLLAALTLGLLGSCGYCLPLLWKSSQHIVVKATVTAAAAAAFLCGSWIVFWCAQLPQEILAAYLSEVLLPALLGWKGAALLLPPCLFAGHALVSDDYPQRVKYALSAAVILLLSLAYAGASMTLPVLISGKVTLAPAKVAAPAPAEESGEPRIECKKVDR